MARYQVNLNNGSVAELDLRDKEAVRRVFQNNGFWDGDTFYPATAIASIEPVAEEEDEGEDVGDEE